MFGHIRVFFDKFRKEPRKTVAVLRLEGVIAANARMGKAINLDAYAKLIERAFTMPGVDAVALVINSPGGSPVQSALVMDRIREMADDNDIPVIAFTEDVAASGGYMIALAADEIYAHPASIVGSIGVVYAGFGFPEAMKKMGVERRIFTAGESKSMLDPFEPTKEEDVERIKDLQNKIHEYFKDMVRKRRGKRLGSPRIKIFSGDVFLGAEAQKLGLVDGVDTLRPKLKERFGQNVRIRVLAPDKPKLAGLLGVLSGGDKSDPGAKSADLLNAGSKGLVDDAIDSVETRLWWQKWGL